jgi:structural maintenance of chromosome 1
VALGKHMDAVVVDREATAFDAVAWLREHKLRPMTFIPLDSIARKEPADGLAGFLAAPKHAARFRLARDVIRFDPEIEAAVLYATGATVIADTLDDARYMRCVGAA